MNLRDLQYVVAVADERHFGRAAEKCFVSQPTLSMQVSKLEGYLGVQLFERSNRQVVVTKAGIAIVARARIILREAGEIRELARLAGDPLAGEFHLGAFPTLAPYYLPKIMPKVHKAFPRVRMYLTEEKSPELLAHLKGGTLDAAFLALPLDNGDGFETAPLFTDEFLLAVPRNHPYANRTSIRQEDLVNEHLLLLEDGHCLRSQALAVCERIGAREYQEFRATSLETLRQMVASNAGITLIPAMAVQKNPNIAYIPFTLPAPSRTIGLVWRKSTARTVLLEKLCTLLMKNSL